MTELLSGKAGSLTDKQRDYVTVVMEETKKLKQLISDFLEFSRFEQREYLPLFFLFEKRLSGAMATRRPVRFIPVGGPPLP